MVGVGVGTVVGEVDGFIVDGMDGFLVDVTSDGSSVGIYANSSVGDTVDGTPVKADVSVVGD